MIVRKLKPKHYEALMKALVKDAHTQPLAPWYEVNLRINRAEYVVRFQPEGNCRMAVLQALRVYRTAEGHEFELITQNHLLAALAEIVIEQGAA